MTQQAPKSVAAEMLDMLEWREVTSSNVKAIAQEGEYLYVRFANGTVYRYNLPPQQGYDLLLEADADPDQSVGKTFHRHVVTRSKSPDVDAIRLDVADPS